MANTKPPRNPAPRSATKKATLITTLKAIWGPTAFSAHKIVPLRNIPRNKNPRVGNNKPVLSEEQWSTPILQALAELAALEKDVEVVREMLVKAAEWRYKVTGTGDMRLTRRDLEVVVRAVREGRELKGVLKGEWGEGGKNGKGARGVKKVVGGAEGGSGAGEQDGEKLEEDCEEGNFDDDGEDQSEWSFKHPDVMASPGMSPSEPFGPPLSQAGGNYETSGALLLPATRGGLATPSPDGTSAIDSTFYDHYHGLALDGTHSMSHSLAIDTMLGFAQGSTTVPTTTDPGFNRALPVQHHMTQQPWAPTTGYPTDSWFKPMYIGEDGRFVHKPSSQDPRDPYEVASEDWCLENQLRIAEIQAGRAIIEAEWWKVRAEEIRRQLGGCSMLAWDSRSLEGLIRSPVS